MKKFVMVSLSLMLFSGCPPEPEQPEPGEPLAGLSTDELTRFDAGRAVFERIFTPDDGLGPLFNSTGCVSCHNQPVSGGSSAVTEVHATKFEPPDFCDPLFQEGGPVIQQQATPLLQDQGIEKEEIPPSATSQALRSTPPVFGFGLVDGIPDSTILANQDPNDMDNDGISGRANRFIDGRLGKFGRKAFIPTLFDFNAGAFPLEQGITTPFQPAEETINGTPVPPETDPVPEPEVTEEDVQAVDDFVRFLAPLPRKRVKDLSEKKEVERGEKLFEDIACASCHIPSMQTGPSEVPALNHQTVFLYSDLLLHDMGSDLADVCLGLATPSEFRTELLMGLRFRNQFLHDGSAGTVEEAIERHAGEGEASRDAFTDLPEKDKQALLKFLDTI
ncbi:hypothetical protein GWO43_31340 [candidate division KSB1 bacterium]|nr:hypothetical protein [candidate division KSB1 bacterium]NIR73396.1 hypothetical protein [candidate division KSB1 bacterium]NIS28395.1 hypothetical protein [candidate division KSB1 bacterium]NIT75276.1 hypothetical protein [candidate division KSB1 bacterium]NIU29123.1 hypothetical protein [candidate division KSB1 bacterium]